MSRLVIVSDTPHHAAGGGYVGHGSTVREIDHLATLFDEVRHVGFLVPGEPPASALPYAAGNVEFLPLRASGGEGPGAKLGVLARLPGYAVRIARALRGADALHVRCPATSSLLAVLLVALRRNPAPRWIKYAGSWRHYRREPLSYRFQRWWLRTGWHRGIVSVNGVWPGQPEHVRSFPNPCLTEAELAAGVAAAAGKATPDPLRVVFAGALTHAKGAETVVRVAAALRDRGCRVAFDLVGAGPLRAALEALARDLGLAEVLRFHGALPRPALGPLYAEAHVVLLPSVTEGWPKVLSEGMACGAVPVASAVGSIPRILEAHGTGVCLRAAGPDAYADALEAYVRDPVRWQRESARAVQAAPSYGFAAFLECVRPVLGLPQGGADG